MLFQMERKKMRKKYGKRINARNYDIAELNDEESPHGHEVSFDVIKDRLQYAGADRILTCQSGKGEKKGNDDDDDEDE
ncbi:hypothetical protein TELCIR_04231 [Teladorsagia circumcincta]|uniref:Uncharacterized protein n=1 Tax=Teladorsagia circumcincta TaxID=45464 RepID=A0A2G9UWA7_TELCI|nr:hypothetical protein TELCIR_04231 [Teladorsagia circumcincta]